MVARHPGSEEEAITWMSFDANDGVDYGRVRFTRDPDGSPTFEEPEIFTVQAEVRSAVGMPGYTLLRTLVGDDTDPLKQ